MITWQKIVYVIHCVIMVLIAQRWGWREAEREADITITPRGRVESIVMSFTSDSEEKVQLWVQVSIMSYIFKR